ncbi:MAG: VTT domain-containing protein [Acidobacteria bacterium]|nr:VTT domain-containing protein [Acidobacteriota bacterium]
MINLFNVHNHWLTYPLIAVAAFIEGEVVFIGAAALVSQGVLSAVPVMLWGALGATAGDQLVFYALRGRARTFLDRWPTIERFGRAFTPRVRANDAFAILIIRFAPGLRIAIAAACAYAEVPAMKFTVLSTLSSLAWAAAILAVVGYIGPAAFHRIGVHSWVAPVITGLVLAAVFYVSGRRNRESLPPAP